VDAISQFAFIHSKIGASGRREVDPIEPKWHLMNAALAAKEAKADVQRGLSQAEAHSRMLSSGPNLIDTKKPDSFLAEVVEELTEPMIILLLAVGVLYSIWGELIDAVTIFVVIVALISVEAYNDFRAGKAIHSLRQLSEPKVAVRRDGIVQEVPVRDLVPGDIIFLQAGRRVAADVRLVEARSLAVDESLLTGESMPVMKEVEPVLAENTPVQERTNLALAGSLVTKGKGTGIVVRTGSATELGRIASMTKTGKPPRTPLQLAMRDLTKWIVLVAIGFSVLVPLLGYLLNKQPPETAILTGLSLAFATIPEELPIIITMVLALGGYRLSKQRAVVKRLKAVETLGTVTVIATDKTGTLTLNRMKAVEFFPLNKKRELLEKGALATDLTDAMEIVTDPIDRALVESAMEASIDILDLAKEQVLTCSNEFDSQRKVFSVIRTKGEEACLLAKGAPESILARSTSLQTTDGAIALAEEDRGRFVTFSEDMAKRGLRVLAVAIKRLGASDRIEVGLEKDLELVGLIGFEDPPRPRVAEAIETARKAGIRTVMITGDHPATARSIASQVGLDNDRKMIVGKEIEDMDDVQMARAAATTDLFARVTPEHKLRIVRALRSNGERIAVTGDGVNDAPALSAADIGIAMGGRGSDVAREAADMVLIDDNYATITDSIKEGRKLFANLGKGVRYYLACKVALISITLLAVLLGTPFPFSPVQIILLELFMDLGASAAFVAERAEADIMFRPPRDPGRPFLDRGMVGRIFAAAIGLFLAVSLAYFAVWQGSHDQTRAQTMAMVTWLIGHFLLALNLRSDREPVVRMGLTSNRIMLAWGLGALLFAVLATGPQILHEALKTTYLTPEQWGLAILLSIVFTFWIELYKLATYGRRNADN